MNYIEIGTFSIGKNGWSVGLKRSTKDIEYGNYDLYLCVPEEPTEQNQQEERSCNSECGKRMKYPISCHNHVCEYIDQKQPAQSKPEQPKEWDPMRCYPAPQGLLPPHQKVINNNAEGIQIYLGRTKDLEKRFERLAEHNENLFETMDEIIRKQANKILELEKQITAINKRLDEREDKG